MALTKSAVQLNNGTVMTAGAANVNSADQDITASYETMLTIKLTNGATGPTIAAQVQIQVSAEGTRYYDYGSPLVGDTANSAIRMWSVKLPLGVGHFRLVSGSNTAQNVTLDSDYSKVTAL